MIRIRRVGSANCVDGIGCVGREGKGRQDNRITRMGRDGVHAVHPVILSGTACRPPRFGKWPDPSRRADAIKERWELEAVRVNTMANMCREFNVWSYT